MISVQGLLFFACVFISSHREILATFNHKHMQKSLQELKFFFISMKNSLALSVIWVRTFAASCTINPVAYPHLPFFLAVSNPAEERLRSWSTGGKTIPVGFALPVRSQRRQTQREIKGVKIIILWMRCLRLDQSVNQRPSLRLLKHSLLKFQPDCTFMEMSCHQWLHSLLSPGLPASL